MKNKLLFILSLLLVVLGLAACEDFFKKPEPTTPVEPTTPIVDNLASIRVEAPTKTSYYIGEELNLAGLVVTATYESGKEEIVTDGYAVSAFDSSTVGEKELTVTYLELAASFNVTVKEDVVVSIAITTNPSKVSYYIGEELNLAGLVVTATYESGKEEIITDGLITTGYDSSVAGEKNVTVTYLEFAASFNITVEPDLVEDGSADLPYLPL